MVARLGAKLVFVAAAVALVFFGIGLLGLAALQVSTLRSNSGGRNRVTAASLAEGCLSAIQAEGSLSWSLVAGAQGSAATWAGARTFTGATATGVFGYFDVNGQTVLTTDPTKVFTVNWSRLAPSSATPTTPITNMNMNEFVVTVTWQDQITGADGTALAATSLTLSRLIRY